LLLTGAGHCNTIKSSNDNATQRDQSTSPNNPFVLAWKMVHSTQEMNKPLKGNGNGNGHGVQSMIRELKKTTAKTQAAASPSAVKESGVTFQTADGVELHGALSRVTRHTVVFELYNPSVTLQLSEVLTGFEVTFQERTVYSGRATVRNVMDAGTKVVCEVMLKEEDWTNLKLALLPESDGGAAKEIKNFLKEWQKLYKVLPEFKVVVADMQIFLYDLRLWLEQVELEIRILPADRQLERELEIVRQIGPMIVPAIHHLFERFEEISNRVDEDQAAAHQAFGKRLVQPLLLCSPFVNRTFNKPLGYAGDYEMVNMMFRDPFQGDSLFAKMVNVYALQLPPIVAHRNRVSYLLQKIEKESLRVMVRGRDARVFSMGCGPAQEVQRFLAEDELANHTGFTLVDFNEETLSHTSCILNNLKSRHARRTMIRSIRKPVQQLLKSAGRAEYARADQYDLIYCAGLFDYLSDQVCRQLMEIFYAMLLPGGLLITTNVDDHPAQNQMECFLEWHLVHRNEEKMQTLVPRKAASQDVSIKRDATGVNVFIEVRKPSGEE
jgi:extracellular factor (EF) 3-hydroxypalmitic acid methyl ester biosynthesis protein